MKKSGIGVLKKWNGCKTYKIQNHDIKHSHLQALKQVQQLFEISVIAMIMVISLELWNRWNLWYNYGIKAIIFVFIRNRMTSMSKKRCCTAKNCIPLWNYKFAGKNGMNATTLLLLLVFMILLKFWGLYFPDFTNFATRTDNNKINQDTLNVSAENSKQLLHLNV